MGDTIFARSTAVGRAGVAVVRLSGPRSVAAVEALSGRSVPQARRMGLRDLRDSEGLIDRALVVWFPEGGSFTGEECAELHLHGSEAVVRAILSRLGDMDGLRPAGAGEFTHRALDNDRLDLAQIEGLSALLRAETEGQRRQAMGLLDGAFGERVASWRSRLTRILAGLEVTVDFADEEVPDEVVPHIVADIESVAAELRTEARGVGAAAQIARGFEVAIVGAPNAGKSTLLNRLAGREAAITSEVAGTTRDVVEVRMELGGQLVTLLDTAGIRASEDAVEQIGVSRARDRAARADLRIFLDGVPDGIEARSDDIVVASKADLRDGLSGLAVSGLTGQGVEDLVEAVQDRLVQRVSDARLAATDRQEQALSAGADALESAANMLGDAGFGVELVAEEVRSAVRRLDEVVGRIGVEDVLGEIFSTFCIGK